MLQFADPLPPVYAPVILTEASLAGIQRYATRLRNAAYGLWQGTISYEYFQASVELSIKIGLTDAWYQGAFSMGIAPEELTTKELSALREAIFSEYQYIGGLASFILNNSRANGGLLRTVQARLDLWETRWNDIYNRAKVMAGQDQKLAWRYGDTIHCEDCSALNGKVKRASVWAASGIAPQSHALACGGWSCACEFENTSDPCSRGKLPKLKGP